MIKIDMEMPKSCYCCDKFKWNDFLEAYTCSMDLHMINFDVEMFKDKKCQECPWIECEDEKSCNNCKNMYRKNNVKMCDKYECNQYSEWERK